MTAPIPAAEVIACCVCFNTWVPTPGKCPNCDRGRTTNPKRTHVSDLPTIADFIPTRKAPA